MSLWTELKRRNVVRVAIAYIVTAWVIIEVSSLVLDIFGSYETVKQIMVVLLALGLPFAALFAWVFEVTPEGIKRESEIEHPPAAAHQTGRRLNILTIGMVVLAIALLVADRFMERPALPAAPTEVAIPAESPTEQPARDAAWAAQQILELNRLRDLGKVGEAFELAGQVADILGNDINEEALWAGISWTNDIDSVPPGAKVWRQKLDAAEDDWEYLGETPLKNVRFSWVTTRVRFDLDGHRSAEMLQEALMGPDEIFGSNALNPSILDPVDMLPEDMVRLPGFTQDLVEYGDYFMDRFEVTNRDYAQFVAAGGYNTPQYWTEPFRRDGQELSFEEAVELFIDRTGRPGPATWSGGAWPSGQGDHPVNGVSWLEAAAYANFTGKTLPSLAHHQMALRLYSLNSDSVAMRSNFDAGGPRPVGQDRAMNSLGLFDQVGNVREWCWNELPGGNRCSFGTAWNDIPYMAEDTNAKSPWDRSPEHGFRLVKTFDNEDKIARLHQPVALREIIDFSQENPASDAEYEIYRRFYSYDSLPLNAQIEESVEAELWRRERVSFDLPSGKRGAAYLFIPTQQLQPFETVLFWPGSDALNRRSIDTITLDYMEFLMKSGRTVALPVFWGTLDRDDPDNPITPYTQYGGYDTGATTWYRDLLVTWVKELSRTIDYLETRPDIFSGTLGFYGVSWGGFKAPIPLAVEADRFDAAVLAVAGLYPVSTYLPESDTFNFVTRVQMPVLMINGEYDTIAPKATSGLPLYEWLGTAPEHKKMYLAPSSHFMPKDVLIRETLDWFDRYLGEAPE